MKSEGNVGRPALLMPMLRRCFSDEFAMVQRQQRARHNLSLRGGPSFLVGTKLQKAQGNLEAPTAPDPARASKRERRALPLLSQRPKAAGIVQHRQHRPPARVVSIAANRRHGRVRRHLVRPGQEKGRVLTGR